MRRLVGSRARIAGSGGGRGARPVPRRSGACDRSACGRSAGNDTRDERARTPRIRARPAPGRRGHGAPRRELPDRCWPGRVAGPRHVRRHHWKQGRPLRGRRRVGVGARARRRAARGGGRLRGRGRGECGAGRRRTDASAARRPLVGPRGRERRGIVVAGALHERWHRQPAVGRACARQHPLSLRRTRAARRPGVHGRAVGARLRPGARRGRSLPAAGNRAKHRRRRPAIDDSPGGGARRARGCCRTAVGCRGGGGRERCGGGVRRSPRVAGGRASARGQSAFRGRPRCGGNGRWWRRARGGRHAVARRGHGRRTAVARSRLCARWRIHGGPRWKLPRHRAVGRAQLDSRRPGPVTRVGAGHAHGVVRRRRGVQCRAQGWFRA